jgi:hypothetical protein
VEENMLNDESKFHIVTTEQKMLQDIRKLLIEQNKLLMAITSKFFEPTIDSKPIKTESSVITPNENKSLKKPCKYCKGEHDNQGQILACAKKNKHKGGK